MAEKKKPTCGIIMPISSIDGLDEHHWAEVKAIFEEAIDRAGCIPRLVSDAPDVGVIQTRIIGNIYQDDIILCDVSARNPNVMFELGLRIAFDKPVVIVKDNATDYAFDIGPMEHVPYPRSLRYNVVNKFKSELSSKIKSTLENKEGISFLKSLGPIKIADFETASIPGQEMLWEEMRSIKVLIQRMQGRTAPNMLANAIRKSGSQMEVTKRWTVSGWSADELRDVEIYIDRLPTTISAVTPKADGSAAISASGMVEDIELANEYIIGITEEKEMG